MSKKYSVVSLGEILVDFTDAGQSDAGFRLFEQNPGGAVANVVCALSKLGMKDTGIIGKVGDDMHGYFLCSILSKVGVDTSGIVFDKDRFTTMAYVSLEATGERSFSFARKPGADTGLHIDELYLPMLEHTRILHVGSLSLTDEPSKSATKEAIRIAKSHGALVSYDPNYRKMLWKSESEAITQMRSLLPTADFIKLSDEEIELLINENIPKKAIFRLLDTGATCVVVTMGGNGALIGTQYGIEFVPAFSVNCIDTTGAGDAFWGAFLFQFLSSGLCPEDITLDNFAQFGRFANAAAALCVQKRGAIPSLATTDDIMSLLSNSDMTL